MTHADEMVRRLHRASRSPAATDQLWMEQVAKRVKLQSNIVIRTSSPAAFLNDLRAADLIDKEH